MKRIRVDLMFEKPPEADEVWQALKQYLRNKEIKNVVNEKSFIELEECHHDESPPQPCKVISKIEKE